MTLIAVLALTARRNDAVTSASALPAPLAVGTALQQPRKVPDMRLIDEQGQPFSVRDWRGKWVILAPDDTACNEDCPITTGALMALSSQLRASGLATKTVVVEASIDPWHDSPARLRAYRRLTGLNFELLNRYAGRDSPVLALLRGLLQARPGRQPAGDRLVHAQA